MGAIAGILTFIFTGGPANPGAFAAAMAVFSAVDASVSSYQAGASFGQAIGIGAATGTAAWIGGQLGGMFGGTLGQGAIGQAFYGAVGAGAFGGATGAALTGGDVGRGALAGAAAGAVGGTFGAGGFWGNLIGSPLAGGVGSVVGGGSFGSGAAEGAYGFIAFSIMSASFQAALDAAYERGGIQGRMTTAEKIVQHLAYDEDMVMGGWPEWLDGKLGVNTEGKYFDSKVYWSEYALRVGGPETAGALGVALTVFVAAPPPFDLIAGGIIFCATSGAAIQSYKNAWVPINYDPSPKYEIYGR